MSRDDYKRKCALDLRDERYVLGLTQVEVAEALHVAPSTVWRWENGITAPGVYDSRMLKRFLRDRAALRGMTSEMLAAAVVDLRVFYSAEMA